MDDAPIGSILICTRNRANDLRQTLQSLARVEASSYCPFEILVIDNGSIDTTADVVRQFQADGLPVRHISETKLGKNVSLNRGLREAQGEIFLTTDDDVRVPANWVYEMSKPILANVADAVAGGVIFPTSHAAIVSARVPPQYRPWYGSTETINPANPDRMVGANMAFHRRILERVPGFDPRLGPGALGYADETLFTFQLLEAGFKLTGRFDVCVEHHFDLSRLTRRQMLLQAERMGRSEAYLSYHWRGLARESHWFRDRRFVAGLWRRRLQRPWAYLNSAIPEEWELTRVQDIAYMRQYQEESRGARRYLHGRATRSAS